MHHRISSRLSTLGPRPVIPMALTYTGSNYRTDLETACTKLRSWQAAVRHIVADAIRISDDSATLRAIAYSYAPKAVQSADRIEDARKDIAAAIIALDAPATDALARDSQRP